MQQVCYLVHLLEGLRFVRRLVGSRQLREILAALKENLL